MQADNVLAMLPGSDPVLKDQCVVVSVHLDGWGIGEPWHGDRIYNGTLDDAAYVATLIELAAQLHDSPRRPRRCVLFAVFTAEEEGMLGSQYFMQHPTIPKEHLVADINLDALRPIFPLKLMTVLGLSDSTLGETAQIVAASLGIRTQADPEPDRLLLSRSDQISFLKAGVPSVAFVFGYKRGSAEERIYRKWYKQRYHSPADDLTQPWDPSAGATFNEFFYRLLDEVANADARPEWRPGSSFLPNRV
ncbi:MAG: M20/M25/M40 family metallo-hydrolase [Bryobacterales bacterium]|nr:M20/M25/M40 family metallo-hydrolase [Bryobacterales bacterium]